MWKLASLAIFVILFVVINANPHRGYDSSEEFGDSSEERYYPRRGGYGNRGYYRPYGGNYGGIGISDIFGGGIFGK